MDRKFTTFVKVAIFGCLRTVECVGILDVAKTCPSEWPDKVIKQHRVQTWNGSGVGVATVVQGPGEMALNDKRANGNENLHVDGCIVITKLYKVKCEVNIR